MNSNKVDKERDIKLSKKLSYLLRHGAVKEDLHIKSDGFVGVNELLSKKLSGYSLRDIERVVANDEKQRFLLTVNNDSAEIRANQGHTIRDISELNLRLIENPEFEIIHGTYLRHWPKIKCKGLSRMKRNHIHFAKGLNFVCGLRESAEIFIYIDFVKAKEGGLQFLESENGVVLCAGDAQGLVDTKFFLKVTTRKGEILFPKAC